MTGLDNVDTPLTTHFSGLKKLMRFYLRNSLDRLFLLPACRRFVQKRTLIGDIPPMIRVIALTIKNTITRSVDIPIPILMIRIVITDATTNTITIIKVITTITTIPTIRTIPLTLTWSMITPPVRAGARTSTPPLSSSPWTAVRGDRGRATPRPPLWALRRESTRWPAQPRFPIT